MKSKILKWWYFHLQNPVIRKGESGGFRWKFRRFWLEISTVSGNFKAKFMADEHPYAYLIIGQGDDNIIGFCRTMYFLGKTITTDQGLVDDINKAFTKYQKRLEKVKHDDDDEEEALAEVKAVQEHIEKPKKERRKIERETDKKFRKVVKKMENEHKAEE